MPGKQLEPVQYLSDFQELPRYVQLRAVQILRMHVMGNVRQRIEAGHRDFVNEIRVCTCLFLGFPSLKVSSCKGVCSQQMLLALRGFDCLHHSLCY